MISNCLSYGLYLCENAGHSRTYFQATNTTLRYAFILIGRKFSDMHTDAVGDGETVVVHMLEAHRSQSCGRRGLESKHLGELSVNAWA